MKILLLIISVLKDFFMSIIQALSVIIICLIAAPIIFAIPLIFLYITKELWVFIVVSFGQLLLLDLINNKEHSEIVQYFKKKWYEINEKK